MKTATSIARVLLMVGAVGLGLFGLLLLGAVPLLGIVFMGGGVVAFIFALTLKSPEEGKRVEIHHHHNAPLPPASKSAKQIEDGVDWGKF